MIIIDPPVGPFSPPDEIENFIAYLEGLREEESDVPEHVESIDQTINQMQKYLTWSQERAAET